jgi:hypothetical protein
VLGRDRYFVPSVPVAVRVHVAGSLDLNPQTAWINQRVMGGLHEEVFPVVMLDRLHGTATLPKNLSDSTGRDIADDVLVRSLRHY